MRLRPMVLCSILGAAPGLAQADVQRYDQSLAQWDAPPATGLAHEVPRGHMVDLGAAGALAYQAPSDPGARACLLLLPDGRGLTEAAKIAADHFADLGFSVLAVDLYRGTVHPSDPEATWALEPSDPGEAARVEVAGLDYLLAQHPSSRVGVVGWSEGAGQALQVALRYPNEISAVVMFYGDPVLDLERLRSLRSPVLGIWAEQDPLVPPTEVDAFDQALEDVGVDHQFLEYPAGHGFADPSADPVAADAEVRNALAHVDEFLNERLP